MNPTNWMYCSVCFDRTIHKATTDESNKRHWFCSECGSELVLFGESINQDVKHTDRYFVILQDASVPAGTIGEAVKFLSWGGVILSVKHKGRIMHLTFANIDVQEVDNPNDSKIVLSG